MRTLWLVLPLVAACAPRVHVFPQGSSFPPKPDDCDVQFDDITSTSPFLDSAKFDQVASIQVQNAPQEWNDKLKKALRPEVCRLGGDIVARAAQSDPEIGGVTAAFVVYRKKS
jgi:hypothetical protein